MKSKLFLMVALLAGIAYANAPMIVDIDCIGDSCKDDGRSRTVAGSFEDDYLYIGNELVFTGAAQDLIFLGRELTANGTTRLGSIAFGKKLAFWGAVGNGIVSAGKDIVVGGTVTGNNYLAGKSMLVNENATVNGNLFMAGAKVKLDGVINGDLYCGAGELVINGTLNGNAKVYGGRLIIGEKGKINGNLTYGTKEKVSVQELARVSGTVTLDDKHRFDRDRFFTAKTGKAAGIFFGTAFSIACILTACLLLFIPVFGRLQMRTTDRTFWNTALSGLVPLLMYPAVVVLSFVFVVTIPLGFVLLLAGIPLLFFAVLTGTTLAGAYLAAKFHWNVQKRHWHFLIGAGAGAVLSVIPIINFLSFVLMCALGWGVFLKVLSNGKPVPEANSAVPGTIVTK